MTTTTDTILAIDLGRYKSIACTYRRSSREHSFRTFDTTPAELTKLLARHPGTLVVIEACANAGWVHDHAVAAGHTVKVANTAAESWKFQHLKRKTDHDDATRLAELEAVGRNSSASGSGVRTGSEESRSRCGVLPLTLDQLAALLEPQSPGLQVRRVPLKERPPPLGDMTTENRPYDQDDSPRHPGGVRGEVDAHVVVLDAGDRHPVRAIKAWLLRPHLPFADHLVQREQVAGQDAIDVPTRNAEPGVLPAAVVKRERLADIRRQFDAQPLFRSGDGRGRRAGRQRCEDVRRGRLKHRRDPCPGASSGCCQPV